MKPEFLGDNFDNLEILSHVLDTMSTLKKNTQLLKPEIFNFPMTKLHLVNLCS